MDIVTKWNKLKNQLNSFNLELSEKELRISLNRIKHFKNSKRNIQLSEIELKLFRFLIINEYKPDTVYRWLLFMQSSEDLKSFYLDGKLSSKEVIEKTQINPSKDPTINSFVNEINWCYECFYSDGGDEK